MLTLQVGCLTKRSRFIMRAGLFRLPIILLTFIAPSGVHGVGTEALGGVFLH